MDTTGSKFTILQRFHDWKLVFDFIETRVDTETLKNFVVSLNNVMCVSVDPNYFSFSPVHIETIRGHHKLIELLFDNDFPWDLDTISINFEDLVDPNRKFQEPNLLSIAFENNNMEIVNILLNDIKR